MEAPTFPLTSEYLNTLHGRSLCMIPTAAGWFAEFTYLKYTGETDDEGKEAYYLFGPADVELELYRWVNAKFDDYGDDNREDELQPVPTQTKDGQPIHPIDLPDQSAISSRPKLRHSKHEGLTYASRKDIELALSQLPARFSRERRLVYDTQTDIGFILKWHEDGSCSIKEAATFNHWEDVTCFTIYAIDEQITPATDWLRHIDLALMAFSENGLTYKPTIIPGKARQPMTKDEFDRYYYDNLSFLEGGDFDVYEHGLSRFGGRYLG